MIHRKAMGGYGDAFIVGSCKLGNVREDITMHHWTKLHNRDDIAKIYMMNSQIKQVIFFNNKKEYAAFGCKALNVNYKDAGGFIQNPYPKLNVSWPKTGFRFTSDYQIVQVNSGTEGSNYKVLPKKYVRYLCKLSPTVIIGTDTNFYKFNPESDHLFINMVGRTTVMQAVGVVAKSSRFFGPEGLMFYVAMSQKIPAIGYADTCKMMSPVVRSAPAWECERKVRSLPSLDKWR